MSKSSFYYRPKRGIQGRKPTRITRMNDGEMLTNDSVVIAIRFMLSEEFVSYGYKKVTVGLKQWGFIINGKKVYRLMKTHRLLCGRIIRTSTGKRRFVKWRVQPAIKPMEQLCMDIKYVYIHGARKNALLLTVLDVYTRSIVGQVLWWSIRKQHVIWLLHHIFSEYPVKGITLRNDNGSQFIAHAVRDFLKDREVLQEFIHVATPQENSFIESYHSILKREVLDPRIFDSIADCTATLNRWKAFYNEKRMHGSLGNQAPVDIWNQFNEQQPEHFLFSPAIETIN